MTRGIKDTMWIRTRKDHMMRYDGRCRLSKLCGDLLKSYPGRRDYVCLQENEYKNTVRKVRNRHL